MNVFKTHHDRDKTKLKMGKGECTCYVQHHKKIPSFETMHYRMCVNKNNSVISLIKKRTFNSELINAINRITIILKVCSYQQ